MAHREYVVAEPGRIERERFLDEMRETAERQLVPGIHTDLTGEPNYTGHRREGYGYGELYFSYRLPNGGHCRVYPQRQENAVVMPEAEAEAAS